MRSFFIILLVALGCLALAEGQLCPQVCTTELRPVCASWTRRGITDICTFRNECRLRLQICQRRQSWVQISRVPCRVETSNCRSLLN